MSQKQERTARQKDALDALIRSLITELEQKLQTFLSAAGNDTHLTGAERKRLRSADVRNYGFIDKAFDIARGNPDFMPANFNVHALADNKRNLEDARQLVLVLQQLTQAASNVLLIQADGCYKDALRIYGSLRLQARSRVQGAAPLFEALKTFFHRRKRQTDGPTEKQLEKNAKKLLHGKTDGEIIIKNKRPHAARGLHEVIDSVKNN